MQMELGRNFISEPMESQELAAKFEHKKHQATALDRLPETQSEFEHVKLQPVQLKPAQITKRDLPRESMEKVELRSTSRLYFLKH